MKINTKIIATSTGLVLMSVAAFLTTVVWQRGNLCGQIGRLMHEQAINEAGKIVQGIYYQCEGAEARNQARLAHDLALAQEMVGRAGGAGLGSDSVEWTAVNQSTKESRKVSLPEFQVGGFWLGQNFLAHMPTRFVDDIKHLTRDHCTIFQRGKVSKQVRPQ